MAAARNRISEEAAAAASTARRHLSDAQADLAAARSEVDALRRCVWMSVAVWCLQVASTAVHRLVFAVLIMGHC